MEVGRVGGDGFIFAVGGLVITGVRFFYFYTRNHYRYCMVAFGTFPTVFV